MARFLESNAPAALAKLGAVQEGIEVEVEVEPEVSRARGGSGTRSKAKSGSSRRASSSTRA
jgi:hypothetical protein